MKRLIWIVRGGTGEMKNHRLTALDGLCAAAGMGIVIYHVNTVFDAPFSRVLSPVFEYGGYFGNYIFFIISGLLISMRYKDRLASWGQIRQFILKRFQRLYPTYFLSNLAILVSGYAVFSWKRTAATFLMVSTGWFYGGDMPYNFPSWFICVLMLCYIIYSGVGRISAKFPAAYFPLCCFFIVGGAALESFNWNIPFMFRVCGEGYMNFFLGAAIGEMRNMVHARGTESLKRIQTTECLVSCMTVFAGVTWMLLFGLHDLPGDFSWWISLICAGLVVMALSCRVFARILSVPALQLTGQCCLSISLWHIPLIRVWEDVMGIWRLDTRISFIAYLLLVLAVSFLSYCCIERVLLSGEPSGENHLSG